MRHPFEVVEKRLQHRLPNNVKNPRKLKKAWKRAIIVRHYEMLVGVRYLLHWVPGSGWTMEIIWKPRRRCLQLIKENRR